jgi:hypothetical protein
MRPWSPVAGEHVWYKSNTQGRWINAEVKDVEVEAGQIVYNLNVKRKVQLAKMRRGTDMQPVYVKDGDVAPQQRAEEIVVMANPETPLITPRPHENRRANATHAYTPQTAYTTQRGDYHTPGSSRLGAVWSDSVRSAADRESYAPSLGQHTADFKTPGPITSANTPGTATFVTPSTGAKGYPSYTPSSSVGTPGSARRATVVGDRARPPPVGGFIPLSTLPEQHSASSTPQNSQQGVVVSSLQDQRAGTLSIAGTDRVYPSATYYAYNAVGAADSGILSRDASRLSVSSTPSSVSVPSGSLSAPVAAATPLRESIHLHIRSGHDVCAQGAAIAKALGIGGPVQNPTPVTNAGGGQNSGVFSMNLGTAGLQAFGVAEVVLKLTSGVRKNHFLDTEAENLAKVAAAHPGIRDDSLVAFPIKVLDVHTGVGPQPQFNLFVMPAAKGQRLTDWQGLKMSRRCTQEVCENLRALGRVLKEFHTRYGCKLNHADFTPANVHYDDATKKFTFVDLGGLGTNVTEGDLEHFCKSIQIMGCTYGPQYVAQAQQALKQGYGPEVPVGQKAGGNYQSGVQGGAVQMATQYGPPMVQASAQMIMGHPRR